MYKKIIFALVLLASMMFSHVMAANLKLGEQVYNKSCKTCHNPNTAPLMKAAAVHNQAAWKKRFDNAEAIAKANPEKYKTALDVLLASIKNGKGAMPAGAMCVNNETADKKCTKEEYIAAIEFMRSKK